VISRFHSLTGLPKGALFGVEADAALALPLARWLHSYLGLVPGAVRILQSTDETAERLRAFLEGTGCADAWQADLAAADLVLASGQTIRRLHTLGFSGQGIAIAPPGLTGYKILPQPLLGARGGMLLVERILNALDVIC
jgi:hypothetical protein